MPKYVLSPYEDAECAGIQEEEEFDEDAEYDRQREEEKGWLP